MRKKADKTGETKEGNWLVLTLDEAQKIPSLAAALSGEEAAKAGKDAEIFYVLPGRKAKINAGKPQAKTRNRLFVFGEKSEATLVARCRQSGKSGNALLLLPHSEVQACFMSKGAGKAQMGMSAVLQEGASLKLMDAAVGSKELQEETRILQKGAGSRCEHYQAVLADGSGKITKKSEHFHLAKDTYSRSIFRCATAGRSRVEVDAGVTIDNAAPDSDTHLLAASLLLSEKAASHVVPRLFVHNADVSAGHGSALTPLSEAELFYLQSRGIGKNESRLLVLQGFLQGLLSASGMHREATGGLADELEAAAKRIFPVD